MQIARTLLLLWTGAAFRRISAVNNRSTSESTPKFPYDPNTTPYCTLWWDNNGSIACTDMPCAWGISLEDFLRWVRIGFACYPELPRSMLIFHIISITAECANYLTGKSYCIEAANEPKSRTTTMTSIQTISSSSPTISSRPTPPATLSVYC